MTTKIYLVLFVFIAGCASRNQPTPTEVDELKAKIGQQKVSDVVRELYEHREFRPVWIARGTKLEKLRQFFQFVDDRTNGVHTDASGLLHDQSSDLIQFDIDVTSALVQHATALARKDADLKKEINDAIEFDTIAQLGDRITPKHVEYERLKSALKNTSGEMAQKIEVNMDRWRRLPDDLGERHIRVNIPSFELEVYDGSEVPLRMRVVVGANDTKTPIFSSEMKYVVFSPYWNIPETILLKETLPKIIKDPEYANRENLEVIRASARHVEVLDAGDIDWEHVTESDIRVRQKPGSGNSLGLVKFMFPNSYDVYLHDTPADNLFDRLTRNFSHGCIRLDKPEDLAAYVLQDQTKWTPERIQEAMHAGQEQHVRLKEPLPVHILYFTAWVDNGGMLHFEKDIYGYDAD